MPGMKSSMTNERLRSMDSGLTRFRACPGMTGWLIRLLLRLLTCLDDVAVGEQNLLQLLAPDRRLAQQEFEAHAEVLVLLLQRVLHDRLGLLVFLQRDALRVPADRLALL